MGILGVRAVNREGRLQQTLFHRDYLLVISDTAIIIVRRIFIATLILISQVGHLCIECIKGVARTNAKKTY